MSERLTDRLRNRLVELTKHNKRKVLGIFADPHHFNQLEIEARNDAQARGLARRDKYVVHGYNLRRALREGAWIILEPNGDGPTAVAV